MGDMIVVMNNGRVEQVGSPDEIYNQPATRFVAGFIGSPPMNFFDGEFGSDKDQPILRTPVGTFQIPGHLRKELNGAGGPGWLGVRPQNLQITEEAAANSVKTIIFAVENLGKEAIIVLQDERKQTYRSIVDASHSYKIGDHIFMMPDLDRAHLFTH